MRRALWLGLTIAMVAGSGTSALAAKRTDDIDEEPSRSGSSNSIIKDRGHHQRPHMLSLMLNVPWWYGIGVGVGGRYTLPLVHDGFLSKVNDSFELEFGVDYVFRRWATLNYHAIIIPVEARWTFYFFPNFAAYAKAGLGVEIGFGGANVFGPWGGIGNGAAVYHNLFAPGVLFKLGDDLWLRGELGYWGLKAGLGFAF